MASSTLHFCLLLLAVTAAASSSGHLNWIPGNAVSGCRGTLAECMAGEEFDMSSEVSRRILASSGHISIGSMNRDIIPCSRRGASYYNCRPGAPANLYSRGCTVITHCRGVSDH